MDYEFDLTIPANTSQASLIEQEVDLADGIIHQFEVAFPKGCAGLVYATIRQGLHQVWPTNPDGSYHWDERVYSRREHYAIGCGAPKLFIQGWNDDDTFEHTVQFSFSVLPSSVLEPYKVLNTLVAILRRIFRI